MLCFVFIKSQSESLKAFQWVPRFVLHYARYKIFIASIFIWFCYLTTVLIVLYLLSRNSFLPPSSLPPPSSILLLMREIILAHCYDTFSCYTLGIQNLEKKFSIEMFINNTLRNSSFIYRKNKKTPC